MSRWRRMTASFKEVTMIGAAMCLVVGLTPGTAMAQTCNTEGHLDRTGTNRVRAYSAQSGSCTGYGIYAEAWFTGITSNVLCGAGGVYLGNGLCFDSHTLGNGEAIVSAQKSAACGYFTGRGRHYARVLATFVIKWQEFTERPVGYDCYITNEECENFEIWDDQTQQCVPYNSPILVPLSRSQDYHLTSVSTGVSFDMNGDGVKEQTAWTAPGSRLAFLAMDRNGNGVIDDGRELFGNNTVEQRPNGFEVLIALAIAVDGTPPKELIAGHPVFDALLLWEDRNHNGISEASEIQPATNVVSEVGLGYEIHNRRDRFGNRFRFQGWASVRTAPGKNPTLTHENMVERNIKLYDVFFRAQ